MRFIERRPGRTAGEQRVVLSTDDGRVAAHGLWFGGRPGSGLRPWADLVLIEPAILPDLVASLGPGASLMVAYQGDQTERALRRKVPPPATPLGLAMLQAGCRWFKDWYYPEGGREGGTKLQGTVPLDDARRRAAELSLAEELRAFVESRPQGADARRARDALAFLAGPAATAQ